MATSAGARRGIQMGAALALIAALCAIAGLFAVRARRPKPRITAPHQAAQKAIPTMASFSGKIRARHTVPVSVTVNGEIGSFLVDVGQDVYEGQLLARIVNPGLETGRESAAKAVEDTQVRINSLESAIIAARLEASRATTDATRAKEQLDSSEKLYRRQAMLQSEGATPRIVFEKAQREFESSRDEFQGLDTLARQAEERVASLTQELQSAKRALEDKRGQLEETQANLAAADVHSPVNGIVVARRGEAGKMLGTEDASDLFRVAVDLSLLQAVFEADAASLKRIRAGQPASVSVPDLQMDAIPATVTQVNAAEAVAELVSPNVNVRPGMRCGVALALGAQ